MNSEIRDITLAKEGERKIPGGKRHFDRNIFS